MVGLCEVDRQPQGLLKLRELGELLAVVKGQRPEHVEREVGQQADYDGRDGAGNLVANPPVAKVNNSPSKGRIIIGHSNTSQAYYSFKGRVYAIRLYDHVLSAAEIAEHRAIDEARFFAAEEPTFVVAGEPYAYGAVQPAYGATNFAAGATMTFTAPATAPNPGNSASVTCTGWKIYALDAATGNWVFDGSDPSKSGTGTTCSYTRPADAPVEKLVWQWSGRRIVDLEPDKDVADAYAGCGDGDVIRLATGDYVMNGRITMNKDVSIIGAGPEASLIDCAHAGGRPFTISDARVRIESVRIFNGPEVASYNGGGIYMSCGIVADSTISNCIGKISSGGAGGIYMTGGIVTNCLITRCESKLTGSGYPQGSGIAQHGGLVTDCRFIANRSTGARTRSSEAKTSQYLLVLAVELVVFSISLAKVHQKCYTLAVEFEGGVANGWKERGKKTAGKGLRVALFGVRDGLWPPQDWQNVSCQ